MSRTTSSPRSELGIELDDDSPEERRRALVQRAVELYARARHPLTGTAHMELTVGRGRIIETQQVFA